MIKMQLNTLESVELRDVWDGEANDFTPWLAQDANLALLGDTLGMELELEAQERGVGPYRADIVCKDTADGSWVLIENQLEATDHNHLGQILTYAAGLGAVSIVWIAQRFTDEHRAALDWLNEISGENVQFFGVEIQVWRIGDSAPAAKFNIVAKPNDWTKGTGGKGFAQNLTPSKQLQVDFWRGFREYAQANSKTIKPTKALPQHWMNIALGRSGFKLNAIASLYDSEKGGFGGHELRAELEIYDRKSAKAYYARLEEDKEAVEAEMAEPLTWYNPENARVCRIFVRTSTDLHDNTAREDQYAWLVQKLEKLRGVFAKRVRNLHLPPEETSEGTP